jgi:hypothetical protein
LLFKHIKTWMSPLMHFVICYGFLTLFAYLHTWIFKAYQMGADYGFRHTKIMAAFHLCLGIHFSHECCFNQGLNFLKGMEFLDKVQGSDSGNEIYSRWFIYFGMQMLVSQIRTKWFPVCSLYTVKLQTPLSLVNE